ncbi:hypothetical protein [Paraburkholderia sp. RL17-381-BIF-C]|uniref:hypothetical protein n=1 Tax=Paraburkholderia sp. RL17-381-BIF-C TaxID=3031635 RepID=UPI0038BBBE1E
MQGIIYHLNQPLKTLLLSTPLEGKYFLHPVHSSTMTSIRPSTNEPLVFRFFSGSDRSVVFCFCPIENLNNTSVGQAWGRANKLVERDTAVDEIGRFVWSNGTFETAIGEISMFFRGSATLTEDCYSNVARLKATVDAKGMAIFSSEPGGDRAVRALAAYMLGLAYHRVLEQAINDLAERCRDDSRVNHTETMHAEISRFIASYYFEAPARVITTEVGPLYAAIRERLLLGSLRYELVDQLSRLAEVIRIERTAAESAFEARIQRRLTIFGVVIAVLGLTQLTQTTPSQIQAFATGWKAVLAGGTATPAPQSGLSTSDAKKPDNHTEALPRKAKRLRHDAPE